MTERELSLEEEAQQRMASIDPQSPTSLEQLRHELRRPIWSHRLHGHGESKRTNHLDDCRCPDCLSE